METLNINTENKFNTRCTTISLVMKPMNIENSSNLILPFSYTNNLKNCNIKKFKNKCIKYYKNGTIQVNGIKNIDSLPEVLFDFGIKNLEKEYTVECVLNNWVFSFEVPKNKIINLNLTIENFEKNNIISYYQKRWCPLIIKYEEQLEIRRFIYNSSKYSLNISKKEKKIIKFTFTLFKSGKCIVTIGGNVCELPLKIFEHLNKFLVYSEDSDNKLMF